MKVCLMIGIAAVALSGVIHAEETIQKVDVGISIEAGGGDDGYYEDEEPNFIWVGPGWYGGYWFGTEGDFNNWGHNHGWGHHGHDGHHGGGHHEHHGGGHHH